MDILWKTACMAVRSIMVDNSASLLNCTKASSDRWRHLPQSVSDGWLAGLSISVVGLIMVLFVVFLCSSFISPLGPLIICVSL